MSSKFFLEAGNLQFPLKEPKLIPPGDQKQNSFIDFVNCLLLQKN